MLGEQQRGRAGRRGAPLGAQRGPGSVFGAWPWVNHGWGEPVVPPRSGLLACVPASVPESAVLCPCPPRNDDGEGSGCGSAASSWPLIYWAVI